MPGTTGLCPLYPCLFHTPPGVTDFHFRLGVLLVEHLVEFMPEIFYSGAVGGSQLPINRTGIELAEFVDMVALAGVSAAGEGGEVLRAVEVVLPEAVVVHGGVGVALHQPLPLRFRHYAEGGGNSLFHAPGVDLVQGGICVALARQGNGEVEHGAVVGAVVEHHQTAVGFGKLRMPVVPPHELDAQGVLAQTVGALAIVFAEKRGVGFADRSEFQHTVFCSLSLIV